MRRSSIVLASFVLAGVLASSCRDPGVPSPGSFPVRQRGEIRCVGPKLQWRSELGIDGDRMELARGCIAKDTGACRALTEIGADLNDPNEHDTESRAPNIRRKMTELCRDGDVESCTNLGVYLSTERGHEDEGRIMLRLACDAGSMRACRSLAARDPGDPGAPDLALRACAWGHLAACKVAFGPLWSACEGPQQDTCYARYNALRFYFCAWGVRRCEPAVARDRTKIAPPGFPPDAAEVLLWVDRLDERPVFPRDDRVTQEAIASLGKLCDAGRARSCLLAGLAGALRHPEMGSVAGDPLLFGIEPSARFTRACELGDAQGCYLVGAPLARGQCPDLDVAKGGALLARSCDLGDPLACENLGAIFETGWGVPADAGRAAAIRARAKR